MKESLDTALNILGKWRSVFAGWQLGTRTTDDPECQAVRDHREVTILLRAEVNALLNLLVKKGVFTAEEWEDALEPEALQLAKDYEAKFPGMRATIYGIQYDAALAAQTMKGWKP
jgi:hypothetical protein